MNIQNNVEMNEDCLAKLATIAIFRTAEKPTSMQFNFELPIEIDTPAWVVDLVDCRPLSELSENELKLFRNFLASAEAQVTEQLNLSEIFVKIRVLSETARLISETADK